MGKGKDKFPVRRGLCARVCIYESVFVCLSDVFKLLRYT